MSDTVFTFRLSDSDEVVQLRVGHQPLTDFLLDILPKDERVVDLEVTRTEEIRLYPSE